MNALIGVARGQPGGSPAAAERGRPGRNGPGCAHRELAVDRPGSARAALRARRARPSDLSRVRRVHTSIHTRHPY